MVHRVQSLFSNGLLRRAVSLVAALALAISGFIYTTSNVDAGPAATEDTQPATSEASSTDAPVQSDQIPTSKPLADAPETVKPHLSEPVAVPTTVTEETEVAGSATEPLANTPGAEATAFDLDRVPLSFMGAVGSNGGTVYYAADARTYGVALAPSADATVSAVDGTSFTIALSGGADAPTATPRDPQSGTFNFLHGDDPAAWLTGVKAYGSVAYGAVYPGIDIVYYGNGERLEYDFVVAPGADPLQIGFTIDGGQVAVEPNGDLGVALGEASLRLTRPVAYQMVEGERREVIVEYVIEAGVVRFQIGGFDPNLELVIDPVVDWATYVGDASSDTYNAVAVDAAGFVYVAGRSNGAGYPITGGVVDPTGVADEAVVTKLSPDGSSLVWSTYLGGSSSDDIKTIKVAADGSVYVAGQTWSTDFPVLGGSYDTTFNNGSGPGSDAFVTRLNSTGTALIGSTFLGGNDTSFSDDEVADLLIDGTGRIYVGGQTRDKNFPVTGGAYDTSAEDDQYEGFVVRFDANLTALEVSTYLGGTGIDLVKAIDVDAGGNIYVFGRTASADYGAITLATAFQPVKIASHDGFVAVLDGNLATLAYGSFLGGSGSDRPEQLYYAGGSQFVVTGWTPSANFPTKNPIQGTKSGGDDGFVTRFDASLSGNASVIFSTFLGGSGKDYIWEAAPDSNGDIWFVGETESFNLAVTPDALDATRGGTSDFWIGRIAADGTTLDYLTYYGGDAVERQGAIAIDASDVIYIAGTTQSLGFATAGAYDTVGSGTNDGHVSRFVDVGYQISGTVFEDIVGDVLNDGIVGSPQNPGIPGVDVIVYERVSSITTLETGGNEPGHHNSVAIGSDGNPVVSNWDKNSSDLRVTHCDDPGCSSVTGTLVDSAGVVGEYSSIAVGTDGMPVISYWDAAGNNLKVVHCGNVSCSSGNTITTLDSAGDVGTYTSIAIGSDGFPVISYEDATNADLKVAHCSNVTCSSSTTTAVDTGASRGSYTSIAVGTDGFPIISYHDAAVGDLLVAHCGNVTCTSGNTITALDTGGSVGTYTSIAIGSDGLPVISYHDGTGNDLKVAHCGNIACTSGTTLTALDVTGDVGTYTSLAIGLDGFPVVSYYASTGKDLKLAECIDVSCAAAVIKLLDASGDAGRFTSVTVNSFNEAVVAYLDDTAKSLNIVASGLTLPAPTDTLAGTFTTDGSGNFTTGVLSPGLYWTVVDSKTVDSTQDPGATATEIWAEQTYGPDGAMCADGSGGTVLTLTGAGACYGGRRVDSNGANPASDDLTSWSSGAEHIALIDTSAGAVVDADFGFSFNVVTSTRAGDGTDDDASNRTAQGTVRQFIQNGNEINVDNAMRFVPNETATDSVGADEWWRIDITNALPEITGTGTTLDGRGYDPSDGTQLDSNARTWGYTGPVGTGADTIPGNGDDLTLAGVDLPELEIRNNRAVENPVGIGIKADDTTVQFLGVSGFGPNNPAAHTGGDIVSGILGVSGHSGLVFDSNVVGVQLDTFADPGVSERTSTTNIQTFQSSGVITNSLIGFSRLSGIRHWDATSPGGGVPSWSIIGNEVAYPAVLYDAGDAIDGVRSEDMTISGNYLHHSGGAAFDNWTDTPGTSGSNTIEDNTISDNGVAVVNPFGDNPEPHGMRLFDTGNIVRHNIIRDNNGDGVLVTDLSGPNLITRNAISGNGYVGIDLLETGGSSDTGDTPYFSLNDDTDVDTGGNTVVNFAVLDTAFIDAVNLTIAGWAPSGATIDFYIADPDPSGFGQGVSFIGSAVEGVSDGDGTSTPYGLAFALVNGIYQGTENPAPRFSFAVPLASLVVPVSALDQLTATATVGGATSEFGGVVTVITANEIAGTVFEDTVGDALSIGAIYDANNPGFVGAKVYLYNDVNSDGRPDAGDTIVTGITNPATTDANGDYGFSGMADGDYLVVVDSTTLVPSGGLNVPITANWAEASYGVAGARCDDGTGVTVTLAGVGTCYGGRNASVSDDLASGIATAEHVTAVTVAGGAVADIDSGYSFNIVTNVDAGVAGATAQGSLNQFLLNANAVVGANAMRFVPAVPANDGTSSWWVIDYTTSSGFGLERIHDADTVVDGTAFSMANGSIEIDPNSGNLGVNAGGGVTVGVDLVGLPQVAKPELEIRHDSIAMSIAGSLVPDRTTIRDLALWGTIPALEGADELGFISVRAGVIDDVTIAGTVIGSHADAFVLDDPGVDARWGVVVASSGANGTIDGNLVGHLGGTGILVEQAGLGWTISGNEVRNTGRDSNLYDAILLWGGPVTVSGNLVEDNAAVGIEVFYDPNNTISNNTVTASGTGGVQTAGIRVLTNDNLIEKNVSQANGGPGVIVRAGATANRITENVFGGNGSNAIDLVFNVADDDRGDGIDPNDGGLNAGAGNDGVDAPVILVATPTDVSGTACPNCLVEVYTSVSDPDLSDTLNGVNFGEGTVLIDVTTADGGGLWALSSLALPFPSAVTAITISDPIYPNPANTSEFSESVSVKIPPTVPTPVTIDGRVFEDVAGDLLADGPIAGGNNPVRSGVTAQIYRENPVGRTLQAGPGLGQNTSMTIGATGNPVITHWDDPGVLRIERCDDPECTTSSTKTESLPWDVGERSSIGLGSDGFLVAAYYDITNGNLRVMHCSDATCSTSSSRIVDSGGDVGQQMSLAIGLDGWPIISYYDVTNGDLKVVHCGDVTCNPLTNTFTTIDSGGDVGQDSTLVIGSDGLPLISYYDVTNGDLKVAHCANASCTAAAISTIASAGDQGRATSMAIGPDGFARIAYHDVTGNTLQRAHCDDLLCSTAATMSVATDGGSSTAIAIDHSGREQYAYYQSVAMRPYLLRCDTADCTLRSALPIDVAGTGTGISMVIGSSGVPVVAYYDTVSLALNVASASGDPNGSGYIVTSDVTDGAGAFSISVPPGDYFVAIASESISPMVATASADGAFAEQTYGPVGSHCADGSGGIAGPSAANGACYGGVEATVADWAINILSWREHLAAVDAEVAGVSGLDFGFSFNVVTHRDGNVGLGARQGSLDRFIQNANKVDGPNVMRFVPMVPTNDTGASGDWWHITMAGALSDINDAGTVIDGRAYDPAGGDRDALNAGSLGTGGFVGVDGVPLGQVARPELEITSSNIRALTADGLTPDDLVVSRIAISNPTFGGTSLIEVNAGVLSGLIISEAIIGSAPDVISPPAAHGLGIELWDTTDAVIQDNIVAYGTRAVEVKTATATIIGNELRDGSTDIIDSYLPTSNLSIIENLIIGGGDFGLDLLGPGSIIRNNTITLNGDGAGQHGGIRLYAAGHTVDRNIITNNGGPGILVAGYDTPAVPDRPQGEQVEITDNVFGGNAGLAIDNVVKDGDFDSGDGVTAEDSNGSTVADHGNIGIDHPVVTSAVLSGANVTIDGTKCSGCGLEIYEAVAGAGDTYGSDYGEGINRVAVVPADASLTFSVVVNAVAESLALGDGISAIQSDALLNTSQFAVNASVVAPPVANDDAINSFEDEDHVINVAADLVANDTDNEDGIPTGAVAIATAPSFGFLVDNLDGTWTYFSDPQFNGLDTFGYTVEDSDGLVSNEATVTVTVGPVNDAPTFDLPAIADQAVVENAGAQSVPGFFSNESAGPPDESGQILSLVVTDDNPGLFSVAPAINGGTGELTYTPAPATTGSAMVTITLSDDGGVADGGIDTTVETFVITVGGFTVTKVADVGVGPVLPGSTIVYTVTVTNGDTVTHTNVELNDTPPPGTTWVSTTVSTPVFSSVNDNFDVVAYNNDDSPGGSVGWAGDWVEGGDELLESPFATDPADGEILIRDTAPAGVELALDVSGPSRYIERAVDLSGVSYAAISLDYTPYHIEHSDEDVYVDIYDGTVWTRIHTFNGDNKEDEITTPWSAIITPYANAATVIRFATSPDLNDSWGMFIDNLAIDYSVPGAPVAGGDGTGPPHVTGQALRPGEQIIMTYEVTVDDPPTADPIVNSATVTSDVLPGPEVGSASNVVQNRPPVLDAVTAWTGWPSATTTATYDETDSITFTVDASDPDLHNIDFTLSGEPAGAAIGLNSGVFTWDPTETDGPGSYTFDVIATDDGTPALNDTQTITIVIDEVNQGPIVTNPGDQVNTEGQSVSVDVVSSDADLPANTLAYSATGLPPGVTISPTLGGISGNPTFDAASGSPYAVVVTVDDGTGAPNAETQVAFNWTINDSGSDLVVNKVSDVVGFAEPGDTITYTITVTNPPGTVIHENIGITDVLPAGTTWVSTTVEEPINVAAYDDFESDTWTAGTGPWSGGWVEVDDDGNPLTGDITIDFKPSEGDPPGKRARINNNNSGLDRIVDLTGAGIAFLTVRARPDGIDNLPAEAFDLEIWNGASWDLLQRIVGVTTDYTTHTFDISGYASASTRLGAHNATSGHGPDDGGYLNWVLVRADTGTTNTTLTNSGPYNPTLATIPFLLPGQSVTITLVVDVDDPLAGAITTIDNDVDATSDEQPGVSTDSVSDPVNRRPVVTAGANQAINEGGSISLDPATFTDFEVANTHSATIDWGDGSPVEPGSVTQGAGSGSVDGSHVYADNGSYIVTVTVTDNNGGVGADTFTVTVSNVTPTIAISGLGAANEGSVYSLTLGAISDPGADTVSSWVVHWGDGNQDSYGSGGVVAHTYADDGSFGVTVDLVDEDGTFLDVANVHGVTVSNVAPTVALSNGGSVGEGSPWTLNFGVVTDPGADTATDFIVDWGDGAPTDTYPAATASANHTYGDDGSYSVSVSVVDEDGTFAGAGADTAVVTNVVPSIVIAGSGVVDEGSVYSLTLGVVTDPGADTVSSWVVHWGDGNQDSYGSGGVVTHTYADDGSFGVTVDLVDEDGTFLDVANVHGVTVSNVAPTVALSNGGSVGEGSPWTLNFGVVTDPGADTATDFVVDWGDGSATDTYPAATASANHTYGDDGSYSVSVSVIDEDATHGGAGADTAVVTNVVPSIAIAGSGVVDEGSVYSLTLGVVTDPGADTVSSWVVHWGDGNQDSYGSGGVVAHTYADDGSFGVTVDLVDEDGTFLDVANVHGVTVSNVAPTVALSNGGSVGEGSPWTLNFGVVTDPGADTATDFVVDWGDGSATDTYPAATASANHTYGDDGSYSVSVSVMDEDATHGGAGADTAVVTNVVPSIAIAGSGVVDEGSVYSLTLGVVTDPGADTVSSWVVHWGDGNQDSYGSGGVVTHTYADDGSFGVTVDLVDEDGTFLDVANVHGVTVSNVAPSVAISGSGVVDEGSVYTLTVDPVVDPGADTVTSWVVHWGDGDSDTFGAAPGSPTHTYGDDGSYAVTVDVVDEDGTFTDVANVHGVTVSNVVPSIAIAGSGVVDEGSVYSLTLGVVTDPGADTVSSWVVHWGDGNQDSYGSGGVVTHTYADDGSYGVTVDLVDEDGTFTDVANVHGVTVSNVAPSVAISGSGVVDEGSVYTLTVDPVVDPGADTVTSWVVHWGDGDSDTFGAAPGSPTHTYGDDGSYAVTVDVVDEDGTFTDVANVHGVTVSNVVPSIAIAGSGVVDEGSVYSLTLGVVTDPGADTVSSWVVHWGDGNQDSYGSGGVVTHTYADDGSYGVTVDLVDEDGTFTDVANVHGVTVSNVAPTVALGGTGTVDEADPYTLTIGVITDPGADTATSVIIDWGDGTPTDTYPAGTPTAVHVYAVNGTYSVTASVVDEDGTHGGAGSHPVLVGDQPPVVALAGAAVVDEGTVYSLTLGPTTDPGVVTVSQWIVHWGDGNDNTYFSDGVVTHTYVDDGSYDVTVDLVDVEGTHLDRGSPTPFTISVDNVPPTVNLSGAGAVDEGDPYSLNVGVIVDPGTDTASLWTVYWGDGSSNTFGAAPGVISHTFADGATLPTVTVDVLDEDGLHVGAGSLPLSVNNVAPTIAIAGSGVVDEGSVYSLTLGAITDPGADTVSSWVVYWGDGNQDTYGSGGVVTHTYADDGSYGVTVDLVDEDGTFTDVANVHGVTVSNVAPTIALSNGGSVGEGSLWTLSFGVVTDPGADSPTDLIVDWGDGSPTDTYPAVTVSATHTFADDGSYSVSVSVVDEDGTFAGAGTDTATITNVAPTIALSNGGSVGEGSLWTLSFGVVTDPGADSPTDLIVDWGDGSPTDTYPAVTVSATHTFADDGSYSVSVSVVDEDGTFAGAGTDTATITNVAPTIALSNGGSVGEGSLWTLSFGVVTDPGADSPTDLIVDWGDGSPTDTYPAVTVSATHTFADDGSYSVSVSVVDEDGTFAGAGTDTATITNVAPSIVVSGSGAANEGSVYSLTLGAITDPGTDTVVSWVVHWGDGNQDTYGTSGVVTHTYADDGSYNVTVDLVDEDATFLDTANAHGVTVANVAPTVAVTGATNVDEGALYTLTVDPVVDPGADTPTQWVVHWGDGNNDVFGAAPGSPTHVYVDEGSYTVTVDLTDEDGVFLNAGSPLVVTAMNVAPTVSAGMDQSVDEGDVVALAPSTFTDPSIVDTHTATVNWGDGTVEPGVVTQGSGSGTVSRSHVYADNGLHTVVVTVADDDGGFSSDSLDVGVANVAPAVDPISDVALAEGDPLVLSAPFADAGTGDTHTATVDWGDGTAEPGVVSESGGVGTVGGSHVYADDGSYVVTVTVADDDGGIATQAFSAAVANAAPVVDAGADVNEVEGTAVVAGATFTDAGTGDTHAATIDWGDGTVTPGVVNAVAGTVSGSHPYGTDGSYVVTVTVSDDDGASTSDVFTASIFNAGPVVSSGGDQVGDEGETLGLAAVSFTDAGAADTHTAIIDWGDGTVEPGGVDPFARTVDGLHWYADSGVYSVRVEVFDDAGGLGVATKTLTVSNSAPVIAAPTAVTVDEGDTPSVGPFTWLDPGAADTHTIAVDWGDASPSETIAVPVPSGLVTPVTGSVTQGHLFLDDGIYPVVVTVADDEGAAASAVSNVTVVNVAPSASIAGDVAEIREGLAVTFTSTVTDPGVADTFSYAWSVTLDDVAVFTGIDDALVFTPETPGVYGVSLVVTDDDGGVSLPAGGAVTAIADLPPVVAGESFDVEVGSSIAIGGSGLLANDSDPEGLALTASLVDSPVSGTVSMDADGSFTYTHGGSLAASDQFTYAVSDGRNVSAPVAVSMTVFGFNQTPVAVADVVSVDEDGSRSFRPLDNDFDPDDDPLTLTFLTGPDNGMLVENAGGLWTFLPDPDWFGALTLEYLLDDGRRNGQTSGRVNITVNSINDAPIASDYDVDLADEPQWTFNLSAGVTDVEGDPIAITVTQPDRGTARLGVDGTLRYVPLVGFTGTDSFTYTVDDGAGGVDTATVTIAVLGVTSDSLLISSLNVVDLADGPLPQRGTLPGLRLLVGSIFQTFELLRLPLLILAAAFALSLLVGMSKVFRFGSGPVYLAPVKPYMVGVVLVPAGSTLPARDEPGARHEAVHEFVAGEEGIRATGRRAQIGSDLWLEVEIPGSDAWVDANFTTEMVGEGPFATDERVAKLALELAVALTERGSLAPMTSERGLHLAHFAPPEPIAVADLGTILTDETIWSWWSRSGSIQELDGSVWEIIGEPLLDAYRRYGAKADIPPSVEIPLELVNFQALAIVDAQIPGKDAWRIFFDYRDRKPAIIAIWREGLPNGSANGNAKGRRLLAAR